MPTASLLFAIVLSAPPASADTSADLFKPVGPVPRVRILIDTDNLNVLRRDPRKYVRCTVRIGDQEFKDVGIHQKGAAGSWRDWNDKPGLTLNFDKFVKNQRFRGLDKINLNNSVQDGSYMHELLANEIALGAGQPACRCTHVLVELNGRRVGLYILKEGFDKTWLRRHFEDPTGNLYDGGFLTDVNSPLKLDTGTDTGRKDLQTLAKACENRDRNKRFEAVSKLVDVDRFVINAGLQIITADWDGYNRKSNNYRVYFDPSSGKAVFIPHGMDQMWQNPGEGVWQGWGGMVARAILDHPEGKKKTIEKLKEMVEKQFDLDKMYARIDELAPRARTAIESVSGKGSAGGFDNEIRGLKDRLKQRSELLKRELPRLK
jgi:spore coat protein CotH